MFYVHTNIYTYLRNKIYEAIYVNYTNYQNKKESLTDELEIHKK